MDNQKATLQELINSNIAGMPVTNIHFSYADPRKLLLDATKQLYSAVELTGKIIGTIKDVNINIINHPVFVQLQQVLLDVVSKYPDLRRDIATRLIEFEEKHRK